MSRKIVCFSLLATLYLLLTIGNLWAQPQCSGLYCHGGQIVTWGQSLPSGGDCGPCHSSQGAGNAPEEFTWAHQIHSSTSPQTGSSGRGYAYACEICHARFNLDTNMIHANGPADKGSYGNRAADVIFHNKELTWETTTYGNDTTLMYYISLAINPYNNLPVTPLFGQGTSTTAADRGGYFGVTKSSCTNIWCHSNAVPVGGTPQYKLAYSSDTNVSCTYCHGGPANPNTTLSVAHATHTRVGSYNYRCYYCHEQTVVTESSYTIKFSSYHVNGTKTIKFSTHNAYALSYDTANYKCMDTYCHSNGLIVWKSGTPLSTATWNLAGATNCGYCHGGGSASGIPNYTNGSPKPNSHQQHNNFGCQKCHYPTTSNGTTISGFKQHASSTYTVTAGDGVSFTYNFTIYPSSSSCNSISCHGYNSAYWGTTLTCLDCHIGTDDVDDYVYQNGTGTVARISTDSVKGWFGTGHGKQNGNYDSGRPAANFATAGSTQCYYCHDLNISHGVSTNPFRLANINSATYGRNYNCLICHQSGQPGYGGKNATQEGVTKSTFTAHWGTKHSTETAGGGATDGGMFCWDCHDPHGDYNVNQATVVARMFQVAPVRLSRGTTYTTEDYGVPFSTTTDDGTTIEVDFRQFRDGIAGFTWGDYIDTTPDAQNRFTAGACQVCHSPGAVNYFHQTSSATHGAGLSCTNCHKHRDNFAPVGCNACHGGSTGSPSENRSEYASNNWWPDGSTRTANSSIADRAGAHEEHIVAIANRRGWSGAQVTTYQTEICKYCHGTGAGDTNHIDTTEPATLFGAGLSTSSTEGFRKLDSTSALGGVDNGTYTFTTANNPRYCDNLDCHWNTQTSTTALGWYANDGSSKPAGADCRTCHRDTTISGSSWPATAGAHTKHTRSGGGENYGYACEKCHPKNPGAPNFTGYDVKPATLTDTHNNNKVNWSFTDIGAAFKSSFTAEAYQYASGFDLGTSTMGTCSNIYCHGLQTTPQWNQNWVDVYPTDTNSRKCSACHERPPTTIAAPTISISTFGHIAHTTFTAAVPLEGLGVSTNTTVTHYRYGCGNCHYETNQATTTLIVSEHAQGKFGWATGSSQTARVYFAPFATTTATGDTYISSTVWFRDSRGFQFTAGRCESVYCHGVSLSTGTRLGTEVSNITVSTPNWNTDMTGATYDSGSGACGRCHNLFDSNSRIHRKHIGGRAGYAYANSYTFDCGRCHSYVDNDPNNYLADISSRTYHVNKDTQGPNVNFDSTFNPGSSWSP